MNLYQLILILKARFQIIVISFCLVVLLAGVFSFFIPKAYVAITTLVINYKGSDSVSGSNGIPAQLMPAYMTTQYDVISSHRVALKVVDKLKLASDEKFKERFEKSAHGKGNITDWIANQLLQKLTVRPMGMQESSVIEVAFTATNPQFAATVANAFSDAYQEVSLEMEVVPSRRSAEFLSAQSKSLLDDLEVAQSKLSKYQEDNGITSVTENFDIENAKLNALSDQLISAQSQAIEYSSRSRATINKDASPDINANLVIQNLKSQIAQSEAKFADLSQRYSQNHPLYQSAQAELNKLRSQLNEEMQKVSNSINGMAGIYKQRESALREALAEQKQKVLTLNRTRDKLTLLQKEVENAQSAYNLIHQRYAQSDLQGRSNQTDISVLSLAVPPTEYAEPNIIKNIFFAAFAGIFVGIALALLREFSDRRIRSQLDVVELTDLPVLATITKDNLHKNSLSRLMSVSNVR